VIAFLHPCPSCGEPQPYDRELALHVRSGADLLCRRCAAEHGFEYLADRVRRIHEEDT
jgi:hypothetical protein